ncbi:MAG: ATP-binding protein [Burkholderiales bacterium]
MRPPSIRRQLMLWVIGALAISAPALVLVAYTVSLNEIDDVLDDSLRQTALLLADRDLAGAFPTQPAASAVPYGDTESMLVAIARRPDGVQLFSSQPNVTMRFEATPGASVQAVNGTSWHVFTVVQRDRIVQVAQPVAARREVARESASPLLVPLLALTGMIGGLLVVALRRGLKPLDSLNAALGQRSETSLAPLELRAIPLEVLPLVRTLNDLLRRLGTAFETQRNFIADAAHELRSPITALQLQVQLLEQSTDAAQRAAATAELSAGIARARHLIEQLLDLSRAAAERDQFGPMSPERVRLGDVARAVVVRWSSQAERRGIDLGANVKSEASVDGGIVQLETLLSNLVDNALRYTPPGGVVDVIVDTVDGAPVLRVIDNGPGLPPDERSRVFDRFYRGPLTSDSPVGSGLGLAIVRAIADRHGAVVSLQTGPGGSGLEVRVAFKAPG